VVAAADEASRLYKEKTPIKKQSAKGEWEEMTKATASIVRSVRKKEFDKLLAVSDPANGDDFMLEVCFHINICKIILMYFIIFDFDLCIIFDAD
jgi:hypothetical protein